MREIFCESIVDYFNDGPVRVTNGDFVRTPVTRVKLNRNEALDLIFELTSPGADEARPERYPAGDVRAVDEIIEFHHPAGWVATARGVIERHWRHSLSRGETTTVEVYSAHSVELELQRQVPPCYIIEWVYNLPDQYAWTEPVRLSVVQRFTKSVGSDDAEIRMTRSSETSGGNKALHLRIAGVDLYAIKSLDHDEGAKNPGQIVYRTCPEQSFRDKVRSCLSFILGRRVVYLGHTEYCSDWIPTFMRSVDAFSVDGAVFKVHELAPYPISDSIHGRIIDQKRVGNLVSALFDKFDAVKFDALDWLYWHAVCSPAHASAAHFGSLIEQLLNNSKTIIGTTHGKLLHEETWRSLNSTLMQWLNVTDIDPGMRAILEGKVSSLNQAPPNLILSRLFEAMKLDISDLETKAWASRNKAAHGGISDDPIEQILNTKVLRLLFHRMLAGITGCSDRYVDYYTLGHPSRPLTEAIPKR
jgi:hypothetical protein